MKKIRIYRDRQGRKPFTEWLYAQKDQLIKARIRARIDRLVFGNYGDHKMVGQGLSELRLHFGSGYRIYYADIDDIIVILLLAGDKASQGNDIERARRFLADLKEQCYEQAKFIEEYDELL